MKYCRLGRTGLYVSKLCLGTANFGTGKSSGKGDWGVVDEKGAFRIMLWIAELIFSIRQMCMEGLKQEG